MKCARGFSSRYVDQAQKRTHPLQETCLPPRRRRGEKSRAIDKAKGRRVKREREERGDRVASRRSSFGALRRSAVASLSVRMAKGRGGRKARRGEIECTYNPPV